MIRDLLEPIVLLSTGVNMTHGEQSFMNLTADERVTDIVHLVDPIKMKIKDTTFMQENYPLIFLFLRKTQLDDNPEELKINTEPMRVKVRSFLAALRDSKQAIKSVTNIEALEVYHLTDADFSGWMLYVNIEPMYNTGVC